MMRMAQTAAMEAGKWNLASHEPQRATPRRARRATRAPPTLWATFHVETMSPRSVVLHQWTMDLPHGGQPMPLNQPLRDWRTIIAVREE